MDYECDTRAQFGLIMVEVVIDTYSGFCFGVKKAIASADALLNNNEELYCVGDIVHNDAEAERLRRLGMKIISYNEVDSIKNGTVLFRAHGEPPSSYQIIKNAGLKLQDQTCPVVLKLQERIKKAYAVLKNVNGQIVIFGKKGHAEVIGLEGQCDGEAIVIEGEQDIELLDLSKPIELFAQTTKNPDHLQHIVSAIETKKGESIVWHNTTCKQVTGRVPRIQEFAKEHEVIVFVGGRKSSNAKVLYQSCLDVNRSSYFVSESSDLKSEWFINTKISIGVCGATSTPQWLMEEVASSIKALI